MYTKQIILAMTAKRVVLKNEDSLIIIIKVTVLANTKRI